jgi:Tfp pilus assembly protein PilP
MVIAMGGCGDQPESEPSPQPPVLRKKIAMPNESPSPTAKPSEVAPRITAPEAKAPETPRVPLKEKEAQEKAPTRTIVKKSPEPPSKGAPAQEEELPAQPQPTQEAPAPVVKTEEKAAESKTLEAPAPEPAKVEPPQEEKKPLAASDKLAGGTFVEEMGKTPSYLYDPRGKIDPFKPLFQIEAERVVTATKEVKKKRAPLTPLQKVSLGQLKVVGIIVSAAGNKALVEDPSGKGYIISKGTYIGQNFGHVKEILADRVVVEEEVEDFVTSKMKVQITELKLQKQVGDV